MDWSTAVPGAIDALVQLAQTAPELEGVVVRDGPMLDNNAEPRVLYIGWTGGTEDVDVEVQVSEEGAGGNPDREQTVIRCTAHAIDGAADIPTARRAAYDMVSGLGAAIDSNRSLNKTVMRAAIGNHSLTQQQTNKGAEAVVTFEVNTDGYTRR